MVHTLFVPLFVRTGMLSLSDGVAVAMGGEAGGLPPLETQLRTPAELNRASKLRLVIMSIQLERRQVLISPLRIVS